LTERRTTGHSGCFLTSGLSGRRCGADNAHEPRRPVCSTYVVLTGTLVFPVFTARSHRGASSTKKRATLTTYRWAHNLAHPKLHKVGTPSGQEADVPTDHQSANIGVHEAPRYADSPDTSPTGPRSRRVGADDDSTTGWSVVTD
jgi:hypothetical protein